MDEARHLDDRKPGLAQAVDHRDLGVRLDPLAEALQPVARTDLGDPDPVGEEHGGRSSRNRLR